MAEGLKACREAFEEYAQSERMNIEWNNRINDYRSIPTRRAHGFWQAAWNTRHADTLLASEVKLKGDFCPECGEVEFERGIWEPENKEHICIKCHQSWFKDVAYTHDVREIIAQLAEARADLRAQKSVMNIGWELSTWAGSINWRGGENQKEWLDDLRILIERYQDSYRKALATTQAAGDGEGK